MMEQWTTIRRVYKNKFLIQVHWKLQCTLKPRRRHISSDVLVSSTLEFQSKCSADTKSVLVYQCTALLKQCLF